MLVLLFVLQTKRLSVNIIIFYGALKSFIVKVFSIDLSSFYRETMWMQSFCVFLMPVLFLSEIILVSTKMMSRSGMGRVLTAVH